jgi:hypothetical protein
VVLRAGTVRTVELKQGERIEIRVPHGFEQAYQLGPDGQRRALPIGATWDAGSEMFYWYPAPGFLGRSRLVFIKEVVYYGFEMNARGVLYDYLNYNSRTLFKRWDATGMTIATTIRGTMNERTDTDTGWTLEASIPWANFEELSRRPPVAGTIWKANFNRWDGVAPARRMSIWSDPENTTSWPHVPSRFGELIFVE